MRDLLLRSIGLLFILPFAVAIQAQSVIMTETEYQQAKVTGTLPANAVPAPMAPFGTSRMPGGDRDRGDRGGDRGGDDDCACWIPPDDTYTLAMQPNDDGSSPLINLPFSYDLYGDLYSSVYINNNGNISFLQPYATFSASGFPSNDFRMVAPFWGDVDTRPVNGGEVWYKVTPTAMYVNWVEVGYFSMQTDKLNSFQVIITNGEDPVIGVGKNVSFCYLDMQWTTGSASGGVGGFGGTPATVGANRGSNDDFIQFGRFDQPGTAYDGPFGNSDGVSWLDNKNFVFTTQTSTQNIPPVATGLYICDTLVACAGQVSQLEVTFLSPESGQITVATSSASTLSNWTEVNNISGIAASVTGEFIASTDDIGFHLVTFSATDDGIPNLTTTIDIVIQVVEPPSDPPEITGATAICSGASTVLTASGSFGSYVWSDGQTGSSITVTEPGTYTVSGSIGLCQLTSPPFTVSIVTPPVLEITGPSSYCGTPLPTLTASAGYEEYTWSDGQTGMSIQAEGGTMTVLGLFEGCLNVSEPFTLTLIDPGPPIITGEELYCEGGEVTLSVSTAEYDSFSWSTGATTNTIVATDGTYTVNASYDNCTYVSETFVVTEVILPPLEISGDTLQCGGGLVNLTASPGFTSYIWNNSFTGPIINVGTGSYFVTGSIGPCVTSSQVHFVEQAPAPYPVIDGPNFSCSGQPLELATTMPFESYLWSNGNVTPTTMVESGTYTVTVTNEFGCSGVSLPFNVLVANDPTAAFTSDLTSPQLPGTTVLFEDGSQANGGEIVSYEWSIGDSLFAGNGTELEWTFDTPGQYAVTLTVTTANGCSDQMTIFFVIRPAEIVVTNVFSPNGDNVNDTFYIENIEFFSNTLTVLNRWGMKVYETTNYNNNWRAAGVPDGTYYYVLHLDDGQEYTGHLTLLR